MSPQGLLGLLAVSELSLLGGQLLFLLGVSFPPHPLLAMPPYPFDHLLPSLCILSSVLLSFSCFGLLDSVSIQSLCLFLPFSCSVSVNDINSLAVSLCQLQYLFPSLNGVPILEQRPKEPGQASYPEGKGPPPALFPAHVGCSPGSLCFLSTGVCGPRAEGPSCLSSGETCVQMLALWL